MKSWILRFNTANKVSKLSFEALSDGTKTVETRAATEKYRKVAPGDCLVFICGSKQVKRKVKKVEVFRSIPALLKNVPFKKINPWAKNITEVKAGYDSFTGYKEKLKKFGIIALYL